MGKALKGIKHLVLRIPSWAIFILIFIADYYAGQLIVDRCNDYGYRGNPELTEYSYFYALAISIREISYLMLAYFISEQLKPETLHTAICTGLIGCGITWSIYNLYMDYCANYGLYKTNDYIIVFLSFIPSVLIAYLKFKKIHKT